jgi:hypothetical protein
MFNELCKMKGVKDVKDCRTVIDITIENLRKKVDSDVNIYDNPAFVTLVSFLILKATKDKDSGIGGDHVIEGALKYCIANALEDMQDKETNSKEN